MADKTPEPKLVRVYNRSRRSFIHNQWTVAPATFSEIPADVAELLVKSYPLDVVEAAVAQKELGGLSAVVAEKNAEIEKLKAELAAAKAGKTKGGKPATDDV